MAVADMSTTEWGILVGGTGTDATTVSEGTLVVKGMAFSGNATTATCALTSDKNGTATSCMNFKAYDAGAGSLNAAGNYVYFGEAGVRFTGLIATLSHANDRLYIYLK